MAIETIAEGLAIGIDLGNTHTVVSFIDETGEFHDIEIGGDNLIPSVGYFESPEKIIFGKSARNKGVGNPQRCVRMFKRRLNKKAEKYRIPMGKNEAIQKHIIFDTNAYIDEPNILRTLNKNEKVILPVSVLEEIEMRKHWPDTEHQAEHALKNIHKMLDKIDIQDSNTELLPDDFFKDESASGLIDNKILSVALNNKEKDVMIVTTDKGLRTIKAPRVGINAISLKDYTAKKALNKINSKGDFLEFSGEEIMSKFLRYIKNETEKQLRLPVNKAVITVPAVFMETFVEVEATKRAAEAAGFEKVIIESEPVAAAIAYGLDAEKPGVILVYDFGGGTFDASIVDSDGKGTFETLATEGNAKLGGEDLTEALMEHVYEYLEDIYDLLMYSQEESELSSEEYHHNKITIYRDAEEVKKDLSSFENGFLPLMNIYTSTSKQESVRFELTRSIYEDLIKTHLIATNKCLDDALRNAGMSSSDIDMIILAGGTSKTPYIREHVSGFFGKEPYSDKDPSTLISHGAALLAHVKMGGNKTGIKYIPKTFDRLLSDFGVAVSAEGRGFEFSVLLKNGIELPVQVENCYTIEEDGQRELKVKLYSRGKGLEQLKRIPYDRDIRFVDEISISNLPPLKQVDTHILVTISVTREYELDFGVLIKHAITGEIIDDGKHVIISRLSMAATCEE